MGKNRAGTRPVHGIVLLDKPAGQTSNRALQAVKRLYRAQKAGHTGSLDPFATGMLPVCLGIATKVSAYLLAAAKEYAVEVLLGRATDSGDLDGSTVAEAPVPALEETDVSAVLDSFVGESMQVPPMYSALKQGGRRLYELARQGLEVERPARPIRIDWIRLDGIDGTTLRFTVRCSKGTYIRSLASDIAGRLETVGHVTALRRLALDPFGRASLVTLDALEMAANEGDAALDAFLLSPDSVLTSFARVDVGPAECESLVHGRAVGVDVPGPGLVRIYGPGGRFVGLGERKPDGGLHPRRIFVT